MQKKIALSISIALGGLAFILMHTVVLPTPVYHAHIGHVLYSVFIVLTLFIPAFIYPLAFKEKGIHRRYDALMSGLGFFISFSLFLAYAFRMIRIALVRPNIAFYPSAGEFLTELHKYTATLSQLQQMQTVLLYSSLLLAFGFIGCLLIKPIKNGLKQEISTKMLIRLFHGALGLLALILITFLVYPGLIGLEYQPWNRFTMLIVIGFLLLNYSVTPLIEESPKHFELYYPLFSTWIFAVLVQFVLLDTLNQSIPTYQAGQFQNLTQLILMMDARALFREGFNHIQTMLLGVAAFSFVVIAIVYGILEWLKHNHKETI